MKQQPKMIVRLPVALLASTLAFATPSVFAHGDEHMSKDKMTASISIDEQEFGREGDPQRVTRTIAVAMNDTMRYTPSKIRVKQGETVKFIVTNKGKSLHEMVIGTMDELKAHGEMMKKNSGMEHDEAYMAHVKPGEKEEIVWQFTKAGDFNFGCLAPGHFEAGMIGAIHVAGK